MISSFSSAETRKRNGIIAAWLLIVGFMVFAMVVLGGVTRLTHSGLSMVNWHPVTGWFPPLNEADWLKEFSAYKLYPEFSKMNADMDLEGFKGIFWFEFLHRLWGRMIGLVFFFPMAFFIFRGWARGALAVKLVIGFILGGLQGVLGWYMVKSGLVDNPDVSQYRLTAHLSAAMAIICYLLWLALDLLHPPAERDSGEGRELYGHAAFVAVWAFATIITGGFVAGLDAGLTYNTFPLMDGDLVPSGLFQMTPAYMNFFENITTVHFDHRVFAETLFVLVLVLWWRGRKRRLDGRGGLALNALFAAVLVQLTLGITTLLLVVPVSIAAIHQAGAVVVLSLTIWVAHEFKS